VRILEIKSRDSVSAGFTQRAPVREVKLNRKKVVPGEVIASGQTVRDGERFVVRDD
jgi:hypothetical protein